MGKALTIGTLSGDQTKPAQLRAARFNRHTFWCGQSGSGKTYALGVVLEQLLIEMKLPMLIIDPNADFVRLGELRDEADSEQSAALRSVEPRILRPGTAGVDRLCARFLDLDLRAKAAVLQLDPVHDAQEFNILVQLDRKFGPQSFAELLSALNASEHPAHHGLALRIENLGVLEWDVWAWDDEPAASIVDSRPRATVLDVADFNRPEEARILALSVLDRLWQTRTERNPILIVIDEAHNLCPAETHDPVGQLLSERIIQIAAEGRKFGLWLLLSTQRPGKVHPNVLSQCDNLALLKMSSPRDLHELGELLGYVPAEMLAQTAKFTQGQALFAGGFIDEPTFVQMGSRLTEEGGSDVSVPL